MNIGEYMDIYEAITNIGDNLEEDKVYEDPPRREGTPRRVWSIII